MDLHEKYMQFPTNNLSILEVIDTSFKDNPFTHLHNLVKLYNNELIKFPLDTKKLQTFYTVLCYEYQIRFHSNSTYKCKNSDDISFENITNIFSHQNQCHTMSDVLILCDILLLQMILYCDVKSIKFKLEQFRQLRNLYLDNSNETRELYITVLGCFLESLNLHFYIFNSNKCKECEEFVSLYVDDIKHFLHTKDDMQWRLIALIIPKLNNTFENNNIIFLIWDLFLSELEDLRDLLNSLNIFADYNFSLKKDYLSDLYIDLYSKSRFWFVILGGLESNIAHYRKLTLFLIKKVIHFMSNIKFDNLERIENVERNELVLFVCNTCSEEKQEKNREHFLLILEALEEVQTHLVLPALTYLPNLIKSNETCSNCFNFTWLNCIFKRILQHENNDIIKQGILDICKIDVLLYNEGLFEFFVSVLNNTFLYGVESYNNKPTIVEKLEEWFQRIIETRNDDYIIKKFLYHVSLLNWNPVAIFNVTCILSNIFEKYEFCITLEESDFNAIKSLTSLSLSKHSPFLRVASQINIIKMISFSSTTINNLVLLSNILFTFTIDDALRKDSYTWKMMVEWLSQTITAPIASNFVCHNFKQYLLEDKTLEIDIKTFVFMIHLLYDAKLIFYTRTCFALKVLKVLLDFLVKSDQRPYCNFQLNLKILELMSLLLKKNCNIITQMLFYYGDASMRIIVKYVKKVSTILSYEELDTFLNIITTFLNNSDLVLSRDAMSSHTSILKTLVFENIFSAEGTEYLSILHILLLCQSTNILSCTKNIYEFCIQNIKKFKILNKESRCRENEKGKIMSRYLFLMTELIHNYFKQFSMEVWKIDWYEIISYIIELEGINIIPSIAVLSETIIEKDGLSCSEDITNFISTVQLCWKVTFLHKKSSTFFTAVGNLLTVIMNSKFLDLPETVTLTNSFLNELIEESDNIPTLKRILLHRMESLDINSTIFDKINLDKLLIACLLHGYAIRRDKKIENQIYSCIEQDFQNLYKFRSSNMEYFAIDAAVKAYAVILFHKIIIKKPEYVSIFLNMVLTQLIKYKHKRYFKDSCVHKVKHRLMQMLLILEPLLDMTNISSVLELLCHLILSESNQHSVRLMQEWLLIRIFIKYTNLRSKLWELFEESLLKRPGCTSSVASVIYHISLFLSGQAQCDFLMQAMPYIACCCLGQNYVMRLYNQVVLVKLYELSKYSNFENIVTEYSRIYNAAVKSLQQGNSKKNSLQVLNDFYFSAFHPIDDYSLQTIYFEIPRLSNVYIDEWIPCKIFEDLNFTEYNNHPLRLRNLNNKLAKSTVPPQFTKSNPCKKETDVIENDLGDLCDLQKKIIPFKSVSSYENDISLTLLRRPLSTIQNEDIIIVASLIDRPANLGGLARTCEIFGIRELIIEDINYTKDKDFINLSTSANKWINIKEVKLHQLREYLLAKHKKGWNLVGVEQTLNSINLLNMEFKKKTILVLGNEKSGISANLIPLFDVCVEIPQVGVIRSLNVHVSGAICIWHYAKQHIFT